MDITRYYLNIDALKMIDKEDKNRIHEYYRDMVYSNSDGRKEVAISLFNTLYSNGYLVDIRDEKLNDILNGDGDKSIDS
jgi:hypothetical protein